MEGQLSTIVMMSTDLGAGVLNHPYLVAQYDIEAGLFVSECQRAGATAVVDVGCWYGLFARAVAVHSEIPLVLVDCVHEFLSCARIVAPNHEGYLWATVVGHRGRDHRPVSMHLMDSSKSGLHCSGGATIESGPVLNVADMLDGVGAVRRRLSTTAVKLDIEGEDLACVSTLLAHGLIPGVLQFEVTVRSRRFLDAIATRLENAYNCKLPGWPTGDFWNILCSPRRIQVSGVKKWRAAQ